jgi:hypothetical protein
MSKKKPADKNLHDACVREVAEEMKKDHWTVRANLPGLKSPK